MTADAQKQENKNSGSAPTPGDNVMSAVGSVNDQLQAIETFIARRFDEISMEINATSQQMDMAEDSVEKKFGEIFEVMKSISFSGDGSTAANTGVELDAVVKTTEEAANKIMDSAEHIQTALGADESMWEDPAKRADLIEQINAYIEEIFMACSFQDVTGQRINTTLENMRALEDRLGETMEKMGIEVPKEDSEAVSEKVKSGATQDDIDSLFDDD